MQGFSFLLVHLNARLGPRVSTPFHKRLFLPRVWVGAGCSRLSLGSLTRLECWLLNVLVGADSHAWETKQRDHLYEKNKGVQGCPDLGGDPSHLCREGGTQAKLCMLNWDPGSHGSNTKG